MRKVMTFAFALLLGASLSLAQGGAGSKGKADDAKPAATDSKKTDTKKAATKKGTKKGSAEKSKKNSGSSTTPPPK